MGLPGQGDDNGNGRIEDGSMRTEVGEGRVVLTRGEVEESEHRVHAAVVSADRGLVHALGDPDRVVHMRSVAKPFQALAVVEDGAADAASISDEELAVLCGSHGGEPEHVRVVSGLLGRLGLDPAHLACGPHPPMYGPAARSLAREGQSPTRLHNNCSGKHAGMLALAIHRGWSLDGYEQAEHRVQRRIASEIARWSGVPETRLLEGVDGCGVVCFGLPVQAVARATASLMRAAAAGDPGPTRVVAAMRAHPQMVAGTERLCTELMRVTGGRIIAKVGAEGVYCAGIPESGLGVAIKVEDGALRAAEVALVGLLRQLGLLGLHELRTLEKWHPRILTNTREEAAATLWLELPDGWGTEGLPEERRSDAYRLDALDELLVGVSAAIARDQEGRLRRLLAGAARDGREREVDEVLLQAHLFVGFPRALNALAEWRRLRTRAPSDNAGAESEVGRMERGEELCRAVYGSAFDSLRERAGDLHPAIDRWMIEDGYGKVLSRPGLPVERRELAVIAILAVQGVAQQLHSHLRGALRVGCVPERVEAALDLGLAGSGRGHRDAMHRVWNDVRERYGRQAGTTA